MNKLESVINEFVEDLLTTETAIIEMDGNTRKVLTYSRVELDGDSINVINDNSEALVELHKELLNNSLRCKKAFWNFVIKSLT